MSTMATGQRAFLEIERNEPDLIRNLLMNADETAQTPVAKTVTPEPGFCIKTKFGKGEKVFINVCKSTELPPPKDISEDELIAILESEDPSDYRVPMSLGEPHEVNAKDGQPCTAYDIVINKTFYEKTLTSEIFKTFLITVSMEGLGEKYSIELNRNDWLILKNKKYIGKIVDVNIKQRPMQLIKELDSINSTSDTGKKIARVFKEPKFTIHKGKSDKDLILFEIKLPGVKCGADIMLDIGGDRVVLKATTDTKENYNWDVFLPVDMNPDGAAAQYNRIKQLPGNNHRQPYPRTLLN